MRLAHIDNGSRFPKRDWLAEMLIKKVKQGAQTFQAPLLNVKDLAVTSVNGVVVQQLH